MSRHTGRWSCLLVVVALATSVHAQAQGGRAGPSPSAVDLLQVPVGGTHIPFQSNAPQMRNPYEGNSDAVVQGRTLFHSMNCVGCHAPQGGGAIGPPLSDRTWIYGGAPGQVYLSILQGRPNGMPSFAQALPPDSIWKLVAYVSTLSKPDSAPVLQQGPARKAADK